MILKFNSFHRRLQFTYEKEVDGKIPFLDMLIIKEDGILKTKWYSKPMASGRVLNYKSNHVNSMKVNVAFGFVKRVLELSFVKKWKLWYMICCCPTIIRNSSLRD